MKVWPVIHLSTLELAYRNASMAAEHGAEGVFLIHMGGDDEQILPVALHLHARLPGLKVGANYLSKGPLAAWEIACQSGLAATWTDRPGVRSDRTNEEAMQVAHRIKNEGPALFFASVAFKYQPVDPDPGTAAIRAWELGFVPTTSGQATGHAPPVAKLQAMRNALDQHGPGAPLALASGADPDNIQALAPFLSHVLVSTGISSSFHAFDEEKLRRFMVAIRG